MTHPDQFSPDPTNAKPASTPAAHWRVNGEPDDHGTRYDCERASLALGEYTDDELANGAFMNYDRRFSIEDMLNPKEGQHMPIVWMTAVKDRIRWLSRSLEAALAAPVAAAAEIDDLHVRLVAAETNVSHFSVLADRWCAVRDVPNDQLGAVGIPCIALPSGLKSGDYLNGQDADDAVDHMLLTHAAPEVKP